MVHQHEHVVGRRNLLFMFKLEIKTTGEIIVDNNIVTYWYWTLAVGKVSSYIKQFITFSFTTVSGKIPFNCYQYT